MSGARRSIPYLASLLLVAAVGCGGSATSLPTGADASVGKTGDGGGDEDAMSVVAEASPGDDGGSPAEASSPDDGGGADAADGGSCGALATRAECVACCDSTFPAGYSAFGVAVDECACEPAVCGPIDGGAPDAGADAGELGEGLCAGTCGTTTPPKGDCEKCMLDSLGTAADPGPCHAAVTACESSDSCKRYLACTASCPAK